MSFTVDKVHLALLDRLHFEEGELAPQVNQKRPYGNRDVLGDLREIYGKALGYEVLTLEDDGGTIVLDGDRVVARGAGGGSYGEDIEKILWRYHSEMATVLQILAKNRGIAEGEYRKASEWGSDWKPVVSGHSSRLVAVSVASSLTETDQDYVDAILERELQPTDRIIVLPGHENTRIWSYAQRANHSVSEEEFPETTADLALLIFDPLMERTNSANAAPLELGTLAEDADVPTVAADAGPNR